MNRYTLPEKITIVSLVIILVIINLWYFISPKIQEESNIINQDRNFFKLNINTASAKELCLIPHISPRLAKEIIEYREKKEKIESLDELLEIKGIGPTNYKKMKNYLKLNPDK